MAVKAIESLLKGLAVLQVFTGDPAGMKLPEVTRKTGMPRATVYRILQTLVTAGYLHYFQAEGVYRLAPKVLSLGYAALSGLDLAETAEPQLRELSRRLDQNVNLGVLQGHEVVYIVRIKVRRILGIDLAVGSRLNAYNSAMGKALLAFLEPDRLDAVIETIAQDPTARDRIGERGQLLRQQLAEVRELGYSVSDGETVSGLISAAVPVRGRFGWVEGAVNLPVFSQFCTRRELETDLLPHLRATALTISRLRGYRPGLRDRAKGGES
jgi:IclR family transcriptional regulator, pca regulon regulatory protein